MQEIDSQALQLVASTLQLSSRGSQLTRFDDGFLRQVLDVSGIIRRGLTRVGTSGLYGLSVANTHAGADTQATDIDVYGLTPGTDVVGTWPGEQEIDGYDVWLLAPLVAAGSAAALTAATIAIRYPAARMSAIDVAPANTNIIVAAYDAIHATLFTLEQIGSGEVVVQHGAWRIPRGCLLRWTSISSGAVTFTMNACLGVFPRGMGQDGIGAS